MRFHSVILTALVVSGSALSSANAQPRSDRNGDPLPAGAIARLGSAKFVHGERLIGLSLSPDGSTALGAEFRHVYLWDVATGRELRDIKYIGAATSAVFSPDGKLVAVTENDASIGIWDAKSGRRLRKIECKDRPSTPTWSPDGNWIAIIADKCVHVWDAAKGDLLHHFVHGTRVVRIAFAPDCNRLVTGCFAENNHTV